MKKYLVLSVIIAAGMAVFSQTTTSAEETMELVAGVESQAKEGIEYDESGAYNDYRNWYDSRVIRYTSRYPRHRPIPVDYRREHNVYRQPVQYDLIWTPDLVNQFKYYYPVDNLRDIEYGREIETISAYDVNNYVGTVKRVYGKVDEVYYSKEDYNYVLYIGAPFPYQDISIVIPRDVARQLTRSPKRHFRNQHVWAIGLINLWEERPEIVIRNQEQVRKY